MSLSSLLEARRSVKSFDPDHRLTDDQLRSLVVAAALAPSSFNMQNRHVVCVTDPEVRASLYEAAFGQEQVRDASAVLVLTGDRLAWTRTDRTLRQAPPEAAATLAGMVRGSYAENDALARDEDCRSVGLAAMAILLRATDLGLASCPMIGFDPAGVARVLDLPDTHAPLMMIVVGRGTRPPRPRLGLLDLEELASVDRFGRVGWTGAVLPEAEDGPDPAPS